MTWINNIVNKYGEILRYLVIGVLTTLVSLGTYYLCVYTFLNPNDSVQLQIANIISWIAAVVFSFFTNRGYVFKSKDDNILKQATSFVGSRITTLLVDMAFMFIFVTYFKFNDKIIKLIDQVVITVLNYILSKIFVFKKSDKN